MLRAFLNRRVGEVSLLGAVKTAFWLGALEAALWLAVGIGIGVLIR